MTLAEMLATDGLYLCGDTEAPTALIPLFVFNGVAWTIKLDSPLRADGYFPTFVIYSGPHIPPGAIQ